MLNLDLNLALELSFLNGGPVVSVRDVLDKDKEHPPYVGDELVFYCLVFNPVLFVHHVNKAC